jgi:hypothetical protein
MKSVCTGLFVLALAVPAAQAQMAQGPQTISLANGLQRGYDNIKRNLTEMSQGMAEGDYTFMPTKDVRTFGQLMGHAANAQFNACSAARGMANPNQGNDNEKKATKAEFVKALADSFAFCDEAYKALTDASAAEMVKQGQNSVARGVVLANLIAHSNEVYVTAIPYYRLKGLIPPSTERATRKP